MLLEDEKLIKAVSTHWMKYARPLFFITILIPVGIAVISIPGVLFGQFQIGGYIPFFIGLLLLTIVVHWGFQRMLNESMINVIITNRRVIYLHSSPLLRDVIREFHMERIRAVEGKKIGLFQNILNYGSLSVNTEGSGFNEKDSIVNFMPRPNEYSQKIIIAMEEVSISKNSNNYAHAQKDYAHNAQLQGNVKARITSSLQSLRKKFTGK